MQKMCIRVVYALLMNATSGSIVSTMEFVIPTATSACCCTSFLHREVRCQTHRVGALYKTKDMGGLDRVHKKHGQTYTPQSGNATINTTV